MSSEYTVSTQLKANTSKFKKDIEAAIKKIEKFDKIASKIKDVTLKFDDKALNTTLKQAENSLKKFEKQAHIANVNIDTNQVSTKIAEIDGELDQVDGKNVLSTVNVSDEQAKAKLVKVRKSLDFIDKVRTNSVVDINDSLFHTKFKKVKTEIKQLDHQTVSVTADANVDKATFKLLKYETLMHHLNNKKINSYMQLHDKLFLFKVAKVKNTIRQLHGKAIKTKLSVHTAGAIAKLILFKKVLKSIPNRFRIKAQSNTKEAMTGLKGLAAQGSKLMQRLNGFSNGFKSLGVVGSNVIRGILMSSFSALIPIIASLIPIITAVGNSLAVVGGAALGVAGAVGIATSGIVLFGLMAKSATKMLNDGLIQTSNATNAYNSSLNTLKATWQGLVQQNSDAIFTAMANGMQGVTSALNALKPFISEVTNLIAKNAQKFNDWVNHSTTARNAFNALNTDGVTVFDNMLSAVGKFGSGFVSILTQFSPLFVYISEQLVNLGTKFEEWSNQVSTQQGISNFINYVKENLPSIVKIFSDVFMGIINLFKIFGSNSSGLLQTLATMANGFKTWSESIGQSDGFNKFMSYISENAPKIATLIGNIIDAVMKFAIAMAPIASVVLDVLIAITGFVAKLFEAHPIVARIIGVILMLSSVFSALAPIFTAIVPFIISLITNLMSLINIFNIITTVIRIVQTVLTILGVIFGTISAPVLIIIGVIAALVAIFIYLWNTNEGFRNAVIAIWNAIVSTAVALFNGLMTFLGNIWNAIVNVAKTVWGFIKGTIIDNIVAGYNKVVSTAQNIWSTISSKFREIVSTVNEKMLAVYNGIKEKISDALDAVKNFGKDFLSAGEDLIMGLIDGVKNVAGKLIEVVEDVVGGAIDAAKEFLGIKSPSRVFKQFGKYVMQGLYIGIDKNSGNAIDSVVSVAKRMTDVFKPTLEAPTISNIGSSIEDMTASVNSQIQHTHIIEQSPNVKTVRVEMAIDNDAITSIVNDVNATNHSIFEF